MKSGSRILPVRARDYDTMLDRVVRLIDEARRASARTVNALMTATYWLIGRHIVEFEQQGKKRAEYGEELLQRVTQDLSAKFGRGFSYPNINNGRRSIAQITEVAVSAADRCVAGDCYRRNLNGCACHAITFCERRATRHVVFSPTKQRNDFLRCP